MLSYFSHFSTCLLYLQHIYLIDVLENRMHGRSSCTVLVMDDGTKLYMKTRSFDKDLKVTAKAKLLKGRKTEERAPITTRAFSD